MNHFDPNISIAIDRQAEKVRNVRAYGSTESKSWQMDAAPRAAWPVGRMVAALAPAAVVVGLLLVHVVSVAH